MAPKKTSPENETANDVPAESGPAFRLDEPDERGSSGRGVGETREFGDEGADGFGGCERVTRDEDERHLHPE